MIGFDQVAKEMKDLFFDLSPDRSRKRVPTATGTTRNAFKQLNSSSKINGIGETTQNNINSTNNDPPIILQSQTTTSPVSALYASANMSTSLSTRITRSSVSSHFERPSMSPIPFNLYPEDTGSEVSRDCVFPMSSRNRGSKRMTYDEIVRMCHGDKFSCVVPPMNKSEPAIARKMREKTLLEFKRALLSDRVRRDAVETSHYITHQFSCRVFEQEGKETMFDWKGRG
jgi:hypothetical protein